MKKRTEFLKREILKIKNIFSIIIGNKINIDVFYKNSLSDDLTEEGYKKALLLNREKEHLFGYGMTGPHRDDLLFETKNRPYKEFSSLGQQRALGIVLKLIEADRIESAREDSPVLLLDDVLLELDRTHRDRVASLIAERKEIQTVECTTALDLYSGMKNHAVIRL